MKYLSILFIIIFGFVNCKESDECKFEGCCDTAPVNTVVGVGNVFVPNIVTNDQDGINDNFGIFTNSGISEITDLKIYDRKGKTIVNESNYVINIPTISLGAYRGWFEYEFTATDINGISANITGKACCFSCRELDVSILPEPDNCIFETQNDNGVFNPALNDLETCF